MLYLAPIQHFLGTESSQKLLSGITSQRNATNHELIQIINNCLKDGIDFDNQIQTFDALDSQT